MAKAASTMTAPELLKRALGEIEKHPNGISSTDIQLSIFGDTKDADEFRRRQQRLSFQLKNLAKQKRIVKTGGKLGVWTVNNSRPVPEVGDVPKRAYTKRNGTGTAAPDGVRGYIIRDIRAKLDELEGSANPMATLASKYDQPTIEHYTIRWQQDLTPAQRATIASEIERERFVPEYKWLKVGDLYVDDAYQRPLSEDRVWDIATKFTWGLYQALWVGWRGGKHYVVDGRHRLTAASILGSKLVPEVPCEIRRTQNVEEEARIFVELTEKRRNITSAQRFQAKLIYGDPIAIDLQKIMNKYGFKVSFERFGGNAIHNAHHNEITAVGTLEQIYRAGGRTRVGAVLQIVREAWDAVPPTTSAWMLRAVSRVLERSPNKNPEALARKLKDKDPWGLIERGMRFGHSNDIPTSEAISDVLLKVTE